MTRNTFPHWIGLLVCNIQETEEIAECLHLQQAVATILAHYAHKTVGVKHWASSFMDFAFLVQRFTPQADHETTTLGARNVHINLTQSFDVYPQIFPEQLPGHYSHKFAEEWRVPTSNWAFLDLW